MQNPLANLIGVFSLVRDVRGFQVNPLCRHDITRSDRQIGNHGYIRNLRRSMLAHNSTNKIILFLAFNIVLVDIFVFVATGME